ncbi:ribonuclease H-like protein [Saccharata proteae CBS 121410]|uniref:Ribonuclease H n=1 Tax=Saccharata proteae CBS 121410 TaxID=1314787 RepID=A0A9P4LW46_9PEZI|nr:ribonuclease H-like protein [Saccharata proteae CBS 121410]
MPSARADSQTASRDADEVKSQSAASNASSATKRKRGMEPKFYAVKTGHKPGVYSSWPDCQAQVKGFKGATFQSFPSQAEAEAFVNGSAEKARSSTPAKFYGVQHGRVPGVYTDWPSAQTQITGWTRPKYKAFATRAEAETFVKEGNGKNAGEAVANVAGDAEAAAANKAAAKKKQKTIAPVEEVDEGPYEPGTGPLPEDAEDGFDPRIWLNPETGKVEMKSEEQLNAKKKRPSSDTTGVLKIYTDGSSLGNGKLGAVAGVGVYFGPGDDRNISEPLVGSRQTNQRAELTALQRALDVAPLHRSVEIVSDSNYSINCVTIWFQTWRRNNWQTSAKKPVENKDLIEPLIARIEERERVGVKTTFTWVKGHAKDGGNIAADTLAEYRD